MNKHPIYISKLTADELDTEIKEGYQDMLAGRIVPAKKVSTNIRESDGLENYHVKKERRNNHS